MAKKYFVGLMVGFGATLGVLVAVAMPPGSWAVVVGVLLGLLACVPVLLVMLAFLSRSNNNSRQPEAAPPPQPIIIMPPGYGLSNGAYDRQGYYLPAQEAYGYPHQPAELTGGNRKRDRRMQEQQRPLPSRRRGQQQEGYYYGAAPEYYAEPEQQYYEVPSARSQDYDAYYGQPAQPQAYDYGYYPEEYYPVNNKKRRRQQDNGVVDAEFRTLGNE